MYETISPGTGKRIKTNGNLAEEIIGNINKEK